MESATPLAALWCIAMVAAKYIGLWGQISSLVSLILAKQSYCTPKRETKIPNLGFSEEMTTGQNRDL